MEELGNIVDSLIKEKQQMDENVSELMVRLEAATKHTSALMDERTFLQVRHTCVLFCQQCKQFL